MHVNTGDREDWRPGTHTYLTNIYCARQWGCCIAQSRWVLPSGTYIPGGKTNIKRLCNKMAIVVHAMIMFRVMCEHITTGPDLVWDQKAFLCGSDVQTEF